MRHITQTGLDLIKKFEGFSPTVYICPAGHKTIGYGHMVKKGEKFSKGIDEFEAQQLLQQDVEIAEQAVLRLISVPLTDNQFEALTSSGKRGKPHSPQNRASELPRTRLKQSLMLHFAVLFSNAHSFHRLSLRLLLLGEFIIQ